MHQIQKDLLALSRNINLDDKSLREIGRLIGIEHPEKIKHHLKQLEKKGFLAINRQSQNIININTDLRKENKFINIPIVGSANCGPATMLAEENVEGYLKVSNSLVGNKKSCFTIKAVGDSMNKANVKGNSIEEGDYVIVDASAKTTENGSYVLAVFDNAAMIKKLHIDKKSGTVLFLSESKYDYPPIVATIEDLNDIFINGQVIQVVKKAYK